jgi:Uma2 family endonuclease
MGTDGSMTIDEFLPLLDGKADRELIRGRLREWPRRFHTPAHGETLANLCSLLGSWEQRRARPRPSVLGFGGPYRLRRDPDTLLGVDVSVATAEQAMNTPRSQFYLDGPPVLAVEVLEPWDTPGDVAERVEEYLAAGAVAWLVEPGLRTVTVHRPGQPSETFNASQELSAEPYLPGFRVAVAAIFDD